MRTNANSNRMKSIDNRLSGLQRLKNLSFFKKKPVDI